MLSKSLFSSLVILCLVSACGSAGTGRTRATTFKNNTIYIGDDGTVVVKGFGDKYGAAIVCVLPPGPARTLADQATKAALSGEYSGVKGSAEFENDVRRRVEPIYAMTKEMLYIQQIYANACQMFGNGVFGATCNGEADGNGCKSGTPDTTATKYREHIDHSLLVMRTVLDTNRDTAICGDNLVEKDEECDDKTAACVACKRVACGDGRLHPGIEECDDANRSNSDACVDNCKVAKCGDGFVQAEVEECDDGNLVPGDGCNTLCRKEASPSNSPAKRK